MRRFVAALLVLGCTMTGFLHGQSQTVRSGNPVKASSDAPVEFLIASAAKDFQAHQPPTPARFRHVRVGQVTGADGGPQYMLCGEFLPDQGKGKAEWTPFVTIKTSGYEQYLGPQAASSCNRSGIVWQKSGDLTQALQSRFESMKP